jgi:hypothetical protein
MAPEQITARPAACCWETWVGGKPAPERCGSATLPGKAWCGTHWARFQNGKKLSSRGHTENAGAAIRSALYGSS